MADAKTDMLPICLPVLPLRGVVMFPQTILNLDVAREKSARAIEHAMKHNRKIFIVAQKDVQQEDAPPLPAEGARLFQLAQAALQVAVADPQQGGGR